MTLRHTTRTILTTTSALALALAGSVVFAGPAAAVPLSAANEGDLITAITTANGNADLDVITLSGTITLTADLPAIIYDLSFVGAPGSSIQAAGFTVFQDAGATANINLSFTTIKVADADYGIDTQFSNVTIDRSEFDDSPVYLQGSGVTLSVRDSLFENVSSGFDGLELNISGSSTAEISGSSAPDNSGHGFFVTSDDSAVTLTHSTTTGNTFSGFGLRLTGGSSLTGDHLMSSVDDDSGLTGELLGLSTVIISDSQFNNSPNGAGATFDVAEGSRIELSRVTTKSNTLGGIMVNDSGNTGSGSLVGILESTITENQQGGLLIASDSLRVLVERTTISHNGSSVTPGAGGVFALLTGDSSIQFNATTVSDNGGLFSGGLTVLVQGGNPSVALINSTVSGNSLDLEDAVPFPFGSAISMMNLSGDPDDVATFAMAHSTIVDNHGEAADDGTIGAVTLLQFDYSIEHSILAGNTSNGAPLDLTLVESLGTINHSLVQSSEDDALTAVDAGVGNLKDMDAKLGALANNGGLTFTHLPLDGSPVINAGDTAFSGAPANDQRGLERIVGVIDMGSVEIQPFVAMTGADATAPLTGGAILLGVGILLIAARRRWLAV